MIDVHVVESLFFLVALLGLSRPRLVELELCPVHLTKTLLMWSKTLRNKRKQRATQVSEPRRCFHYSNFFANDVHVSALMSFHRAMPSLLPDIRMNHKFCTNKQLLQLLQLIFIGASSREVAVVIMVSYVNVYFLVFVNL